MNAYIVGLGALSVISVLGGMANLWRLTRQSLKREREHGPGHTIDLERELERTTDVSRRAA